MRNNHLAGVFLLMFLILGNMNVSGQSKTHEFGLRFTSLNNFDFVYKKGKKENKFTRFRLGLANIAFQQSTTSKRYSFSFGFAIGLEKRSKISERLYFIHGIEPTLSFSTQYVDIEDGPNDYSSNTSVGIGYVLGFQYDISETFYVNIESIPFLSGTFWTDNDGFNDNYTIIAGFNSNSIAFSLVYRFTESEL